MNKKDKLTDILRERLSGITKKYGDEQGRQDVVVHSKFSAHVRELVIDISAENLQKYFGAKHVFLHSSITINESKNPLPYTVTVNLPFYDIRANDILRDRVLTSMVEKINNTITIDKYNQYIHSQIEPDNIIDNYSIWTITLDSSIRNSSSVDDFQIVTIIIALSEAVVKQVIYYMSIIVIHLMNTPKR